MGKIAIKLMGALVLILSIGLFWYNYDSKDIRISSVKFKKKQKYYQTANLSLVSNIGPTYQMKMDLSIPCQTKTQYSDLTYKMPRIKSALLTTMDQGEMTNLIEDRDFDAIKKAYMGVINRFVEKPVNTIYIESFNY